METKGLKGKFLQRARSRFKISIGFMIRSRPCCDNIQERCIGGFFSDGNKEKKQSNPFPLSIGRSQGERENLIDAPSAIAQTPDWGVEVCR
jgi:hypothetical protein